MKTFKIEIQEFLSKIIEVEASNIDEAIKNVKELYFNEEIVLTGNEFVTFEINEYTE